MIPSAFMTLDHFPLTINGKLDRKALPDPELINETSYVAPNSDLEIQLCGIWQEVLNLEKIGISDDFFRIGGDSILSIQLSSRLRKHGLNCSVSAIFDHRTITQLAHFLASNVDVVEIISEQGILEGEFNLLPIQEWFFDKLEAKQLPLFNHWNQSFLVKVPELEFDKLQGIIQALSEQHDVLRTRFTDRKQSYLSTITVPELYKFDVKDQSKEEIDKTLTNWQSNFDIHDGPLWNVAYLEGYQDRTARLYFALHHLIVDTVSWRILIEDFKTLYNTETLEDKTSSYRQWTHEISLYAEQHPEEKMYWDTILNTIPKRTIVEEEPNFSKVEISKKHTSQLLQHANKAYHTEVNDILLTALGLTLQSWNNTSKQGITLEGHGRESLNETIDHSKTVGWFTSMYPVQLELQQNLGSSIKSIKENLRAIPNKGIGFGAMYPNELINLPNITFNYLGQFDSQDGYWQVTGESSGEPIPASNAETDIINITGIVTDGQLSFSILSKLSEKEASDFSNNLQKHLEEVIIHCIDQIDRNEIKHTPSDFETVTISQSLLDEIEKDQQIESIYLANSLQQGFIYHALSQQGDDAYRGQFLFDYKQELNVDNYIQSWELAIEKYPILRTGFNWEEELIQIVYSTAKLTYDVLDISHLSTSEREDYIINLQQEDRKIPFDLKEPCLLRLYILKQTAKHYTIIKSEHHSILDGWSGPVLLNNIHKDYYELQQNKQVKVKVDHAYLEAQNYFAKEKDTVEKYWEDKKTIIEHTNDLNPLLSCKQELDTIKSLVQPFDTTIEIAGEQYKNLKDLTRSKGLSINTLIQFAWHKLIQTYTQDAQTIVGTTVSGRAIPITGVEDSVGLYINTLPLIIDWDNDHTVLEQVQYIHKQITDLNSHSFANLANLQEQGKRLFHSLLVFENYPTPEKSDDVSKDTLNPEFRYSVEKLDYPLGLTVSEYGGKLEISLKSDRDLLDSEKAHYNLGKIELLLDELIVNLDKKHNTISTLSLKEYDQIVFDWNKTDTVYPNDKTIHQLFEEQVLKTPNNIAIVFEEEELTYGELNSKANQLARHLQATIEIKPDTLVGLCLDKSLEMIIGILGILKAGGAYVPIDPEYPSDRIDYILKDTATNLVLTQNALVDRLTAISDIGLLALDSISYQNEESTNLSIQNQSTNLAYVIYTSGTTGKPKGVCLQHKGLNNLVFIQKEKLNINSNSKFIQFASIVFDASVWEIFSALTFGASLNIISNEARLDVVSLNKFIADNHINTALLPPIILRVLSPKNIDCLAHLVIGGDRSNDAIVAKWIENRAFINAYGPTEITVCATMHEYKTGDLNTKIGRPLNNFKCYVLDANNKPTPVGVVGELLIGGGGLARGYLNRPELTDEKFIENPFATKEDQANGYTKLYKTGDLVKWLSDGTIEYIGRNDFQVKVRGYRIELGEIENALNAIEEIDQSCVLVKEKNDTIHLVGYFKSSTKIDEEVIIEALSSQLPDYMIPSAFIQLDRFPLTINGKLDRKALPNPDFVNKESYVAPTSDLEIKLCTIWQEILSLEKVGIEDNFFRIGGNSILAIRLSHKISKALATNISVADIFSHKTISCLGDFLKSNEIKQIAITPQNLEEYPLSFAQERLWFIEQYEQGTNAYHIPLLVELQENTDRDRLKYAIDQVVRRHEVLRTVFKEDEGEYTQVIIDDDLVINEYHSTDIDLQIERDINTSFDLQNELPIRVSLYHKNNKTFLLINIHHIASDGWSTDILLKEITAFYNDDHLPSLSIQYKDFSAWQRSYLKGDILQTQINYWQEKLQGYELLSLPIDKARPKQIDYAGANFLFTIEEELSNKLRELSNSLGCTMYTTLLSGFYILLSKHAAQDDIVLGTPIANRHYSEIQDLIGFFVNSLALRENINQQNNITELIHQVQSNLIEAQRYQDIPFEKIVDVLNVEQDTSRHPIFQVMFGVQSFGDVEDQLFKTSALNDLHPVAHYELSCFMDDSVNEIEGTFNFATTIYEQSTIERMADHYLLILNQMVDDQNKQLKNYNLLSSDEYQQIVLNWNQTDVAYPTDKTINQLFEEQASKTPNNIALAFDGKQLSYKELNEKSNQLAIHIRTQYFQKTKQELAPGTFIALFLERSVEMVVGIMAVLKSGAAYVPIDSLSPQSNIDYILEDTQAEFVLTKKHLKGGVYSSLPNEKVMYIDLDEELYNNEENLNITSSNTALNLAYAIYTSGTTGNPKGVLIKHKAVCNLINFHNKRYSELSTNLQVGLVSSYNFDFSIQQIFNTILFGHTLHVLSKDCVLNPSRFNDYLMTNEIEVFEITPTLFLHLILPFNNYEFSKLKLINIGGEHLSSTTVSKFLTKKLPDNISIINTYGPTEFTVDATFYEIDCNIESFSTHESVYIGKPIDNTKAYILDHNMMPAPIGIVGELYLGGAGLSEGYLNLHELTKSSFVKNPFATKEDLSKGYSKLYKTGDLVRWMPDGNIEYIGRNDFQVKIRGYRIELEEIENALVSIDEIKQVCVLAKEKNGNDYLVAYYVSENEIAEESILNTLSVELPDYMIPSLLVQLESLPLTKNGKLDRKMLPDPDFTNTDSYLAPTSEMEIELCRIWEEALGVDNVGIKDNFFRIGGNSILAIKLSHQINKVLDTVTVVADIFNYKTVQELSNYILSLVVEEEYIEIEL
jgi:amino acid adenylation domain-containing protein/non-ribosomal peptide synthase protein (TIGR01720 family)